jgi:hypothetical protein
MTQQGDSTPGQAHPSTFHTRPTREHEWLQTLIGTWTYDPPAAPGHPAPPSATETVRALGDVWVVGESTAQAPDGSVAHSMITLGYDPRKKRFVGTWVGSMMSHLWVYEGELDAAGRRLTLDCVGPSMSGDGTMRNYQDVIEILDDDRRVLTARVQNDDGTWQQFMTVEYQRTR